MRSNLYQAIFIVLFAFATYPALAQTVPAGKKAILPFAIGSGLSDYNPEYGHGHLLGGTLWIDYTPNRIPNVLRGAGIDIEARDLSLDRSASEPANLREDLAEGGVLYRWSYFHNYHFYGKFLMGFGNADHESGTVRMHDSRTVASVGGGGEFWAFRNVWIRADYEYERWPDMFFLNKKPIGSLNPQGLTIGVIYYLNHPHFH